MSNGNPRGTPGFTQSLERAPIGEPLIVHAYGFEAQDLVAKRIGSDADGRSVWVTETEDGDVPIDVTEWRFKHSRRAH